MGGGREEKLYVIKECQLLYGEGKIKLENYHFTSENVRSDLGEITKWGISGGAVVKNPPAHAGDKGSIPHAMEQLGLCATTTEPVI